MESGFNDSRFMDAQERTYRAQLALITASHFLSFAVVNFIEAYNIRKNSDEWRYEKRNIESLRRDANEIEDTWARLRTRGSLEVVKIPTEAYRKLDELESILKAEASRYVKENPSL